LRFSAEANQREQQKTRTKASKVFRKVLLQNCLRLTAKRFDRFHKMNGTQKMKKDSPTTQQIKSLSLFL